MADPTRYWIVESGCPSAISGLSPLVNVLPSKQGGPAVIQPWWPLAGLAAIQLGDAVLCLKPVGFIRDCLTDVTFPRRYWRLLPVLKAAAAAGLTAGIWAEPLAVITAAALVAYFVVAIGFHIRARDFGRNLFVNASGMLVLCTFVLAVVLRSG